MAGRWQRASLDCPRLPRKPARWRRAGPGSRSHAGACNYLQFYHRTSQPPYCWARGKSDPVMTQESTLPRRACGSAPPNVPDCECRRCLPYLSRKIIKICQGSAKVCTNFHESPYLFAPEHYRRRPPLQREKPLHQFVALVERQVTRRRDRFIIGRLTLWNNPRAGQSERYCPMGVGACP